MLRFCTMLGIGLEVALREFFNTLGLYTVHSRSRPVLLRRPARPSVCLSQLDHNSFQDSASHCLLDEHTPKMP